MKRYNIGNTNAADFYNINWYKANEVAEFMKRILDYIKPRVQKRHKDYYSRCYPKENLQWALDEVNMGDNLVIDLEQIIKTSAQEGKSE